MSLSLFRETMNNLFSLINPGPTLSPALSDVLEASYTFSRMLHASKSLVGGGAMESSGFYRAYVPAIGSQLDPGQLGEFEIRANSRVWLLRRSMLTPSRLPFTELIKKCYRTERGTLTRSPLSPCLSPPLARSLTFLMSTRRARTRRRLSLPRSRQGVRNRHHSAPSAISSGRRERNDSEAEEGDKDCRRKEGPGDLRVRPLPLQVRAR
jgi:hypothetical protein